MRYLAALLLVMALALLATAPAQAQYYGEYNKWEVAPFVGYETGGSYPINSSLTVDRLRINSGLSYGTFVDYSLTENTQAEFMWSQNNTSFSAHDVTTNTYSKAFNSTFDQFMFGFSYMIRNSERKLRPFIDAGLGFAHESNNNGEPNHTLFAFALGGGAKYELTKHFALRGDVRYMPSRANRTPQTFCDPFFGCYTQNTPNYLQRVNLTAGIAFRFK